MIKTSKILAIILARGGSKRLPRKNLLKLHGKPLIEWTINSGLNSKYIDRLLVSSDSDEILNFSKGIGADAMKRSAALSSDEASSFSAVESIIYSLNEKFDYVLLLQPTSPLRTEIHIDESIELLLQTKSDAVISVCRSSFNPDTICTVKEDFGLVSFKDKKNDINIDKPPQFFRINGAIYLCNVDKLLDERSFLLKNNTYAYIMSRKCSIDIDYKYEFDIAGHFMGTRYES